MNDLSMKEPLPFPEIRRFLRAMGRVNREAYAALTPIVREELTRRLPPEWISACMQKPQPVERKYSNLRNLMHSPFPVNDAPQLHIQRVPTCTTQLMLKHRDGSHGAFLMAVGLFSARKLRIFAGPQDELHSTLDTGMLVAT